MSYFLYTEKLTLETPNKMNYGFFICDSDLCDCEQKAITAQVEEKRRKKQLEEEQRKKEELEEELRLAREREEMQKQYEEDILKQKQKEVGILVLTATSQSKSGCVFKGK